MKIKIRNDSVLIEGYVNAVERVSKPLWSRVGQFIERICAGAFRKALSRADDVFILLNHDWNRNLGSIKSGNLELKEDNIGLHMRAVITDPEVIETARNGNLVGCSFGFRDRDVEMGVEDGLPLRKVKDLDLAEVSILDRTRTPAYAGTLVSVRSVDGEEEINLHGEDNIDENVEVLEEGSNPEKREEDNGDEKGGEADKKGEDVEKAVEKPVEKNGNVHYNKVVDILNDIKEDLIDA